MAEAGTTGAALRLPLLLLLALLLSALGPSCQARVMDLEGGKTAFNSPSYEELASSLVVNQLAILKLMQDSSNASCAAVQVWREREAGRSEEVSLQEALGTHVAGMQQALEALQTGQRQHTLQVLEALSNTTQGTLSKVEQLREQMRQELNEIRQEVQQSLKITTTTTTTTTPAAQPIVQTVPAPIRAILHNDTVSSLCSGSKVLVGTMGSLEVVRSGTYSSSVECSWKLQFNSLSSVTLTWEYIDMEEHGQCAYDWVQVSDLSHSSNLVYGRKLCGSVGSTMLKLLEIEVPETSSLLVSFRSDGSNQKRGFKLFYHTH